MECAEFHKDLPAAAKLESETNQFEIKAIHGKIRKQKEWMDSRVGRLKEIVKDKFRAHPHLKAQLQQTKGFIYEATSDKTFGCYMGLHQCNRISQTNITGKNLMGKVLEDIREDRL